jgi:hypothetical protein
MKSLVFFWVVWLASLIAQAQVATNAPGTFSGNPASGPDWEAAIEKLGKEAANAEAASEAAHSKLLTDALSQQEKASATAKAASAPQARASDAVAPIKSEKKGDDEDWAGTVRHSVKEIVKPFQEFLPASDANKEIDPAEEERRRSRAALQAPGQGAPVLTESQRRAQQFWTSVMIEELIDELLPWAIGVVVLAALGYGVSLWVAFMKRKPSVRSAPSTRAQSSKKQHRRST